MKLRILAVGLALLCLTTTLHAEGRPPGKYEGVAVFDRWDGCILCSGLYISYVSESLKESLRPFDGMHVVVDASSFYQPVNPGDGLITGFNSPPSKISRRDSVPIRLEALPELTPGRRPAMVIRLKNTGQSEIEIYSGGIGFTLLMKMPDRRPGFFPTFIPSDSPAFALMARQSFLNTESPGTARKGTTAGIRHSWLTDSRLPRTLTLAAGVEKRVRIELEIPAGEYEFLVGHRGNGQSIVSNRVAFDVMPNGAAKHIVIDRSKPKLVPQISHASRITALDCSADGRWLVSASWDRSVHVRDARSLRLHRVLRGDQMLTTVAVTRDGHQIAACGTSGLIRVWDRATGILRLTLGQKQDNEVSNPSVDFSPDGKILASVVDGHKVQLWRIPYGFPWRQLGDPEDWYQQVRFSPDGKSLAASGRKGVRIWDVESGELVQTLLQKRSGALRGPQPIAWSPDGSRLVQVTTNWGVWNADRGWDASTLAEVNIWEPFIGKCVHKVSLPLGQEMGSVAWSPDGEYLALTGAHSTVWRTADWEVVKMPARSNPAWRRVVESTCVSFLPPVSLPNGDSSSNDKLAGNVADDGTRVAFGWEDGTLSVTSVERKSNPKTVSGRSRLSLVPQRLDGNRVASRGTAGQLIVWDLDEAKVSAIQNFEDAEWVDILAVSPDGQRVVGRFGTQSHQRPIELRHQGRRSQLASSSRTDRSSAAFSTDGKQFFVCNGSNIENWRFHDEEPRQVSMEYPVGGRGLISLSDDGARLATCTDDWIEEGRRVRSQPGGHINLVNTQDGMNGCDLSEATTRGSCELEFFGFCRELKWSWRKRRPLRS
jgi:WD40 repeat protein